MVNKELIRKLISFDDEDTSTGHVSVSGSVHNFGKYQGLLEQIDNRIKQQDLVGFRESVTEFIMNVCDEFGSSDDDTVSGESTEYYWFFTDDEQALDLPIQDLRKVTERYRQGSNFYLEMIGVGFSSKEGALIAVTYDFEYRDTPLTKIRKFRDTMWRGCKPEMFMDINSRFWDKVLITPSPWRKYVWRNARAIHKYLTRLLQHLKFVQ